MPTVNASRVLPVTNAEKLAGGFASLNLPTSKLAPTSFPQPDGATFVTIAENNQLFPILTAYIVTHRSPTDPSSSLTYDALTSAKKNAASPPSSTCCGGHGGANPCAAGAPVSEGQDLLVDAGLGVGVHRFTDNVTGAEFIAIMQDIADPVGTGCGASILSNLVLCALNSSPENNELALRHLCSRCWEESQAEKKGVFKVFRFNAKHEYWYREAVVPARPLDSVVIPKEMKDKLLNDLDEFLSADTKEFYAKHGIPYKRSYLLHGVPGGGKTSLIQAVAGAYGRCLAFLQPTHPDMTDDALRAAMQRVPRNALVVLEDIDALFAKDRSKKTKDSPLTFSGLLNALDGVGSADGQLCFITTNFREQLDAALIRNGRIDMHVYFGPVNDEQCRVYFKRFYGSSAAVEEDEEDGEVETKKRNDDDGHDDDDDDSLAAQFGRAVMASLKTEDREISTAALQHFFVTHRKCTAQEALAAVGDIIDEIKLREEEEKAEKAESEERFEVGQKVEADYKALSKYFPGTIEKVNEGGTYDIKYDDGTSEDGVESNLIRKREEKADGESKDSNAVDEAKDENQSSISGGQYQLPGLIAAASFGAALATVGYGAALAAAVLLRNTPQQRK